MAWVAPREDSRLTPLLISLALAAALTAASSGWQAAFVTNPNPSLRQSQQNRPGHGCKECGSGSSSSEDAMLTIAGVAGATGLLGLAAASATRRQAEQQATVTRLRATSAQDPGKAIENFFKPRFGKGTSRDLPRNAEQVGTLKILYEVELTSPLGITLTDGPKGPGQGCGVALVLDSGSAPELRNKVLMGEGAQNSMFVQEGDQLEAVNGQSIEGYKEKAQFLVQNAPPGEPIRFTFSRAPLGAITVVFPGGIVITAPRGAPLNKLAKKAGYDCGCTCLDGRCGKCWHRDPVTGEAYCFPLNVPGVVPSIWRDSGEDGVMPAEGQFECWIPLFLEPAPEELEKALIAEAAYKQKRRLQGGLG